MSGRSRVQFSPRTQNFLLNSSLHTYHSICGNLFWGKMFKVVISDHEFIGRASFIASFENRSVKRLGGTQIYFVSNFRCRCRQRRFH